MTLLLPFRGDQVGSYLRPQVLKQAAIDLKAGKISQKDLTAIEDAEIKKLVEKQVAAGLKCVTDGEFRRQSWLFDFHWGFLNVDHFTPAEGMKFANSTASIIDLIRYTGKVQYNPDHPFFAAFEYLKSVTPEGIVPKVCIPSAGMLLFDIISGKAPEPYTSVDEFIADIATAYQKTIQHFYDIGLRYLQIDDCAWSQAIGAPVDHGEFEIFPGFKTSVENIASTVLRLNQQSLLNRERKLFITMHNCRGNNQSDYASSGPYTKVSKYLAQLDVDAFFLEFDGLRCGGFEGLKDIADGPYGKNLKIVLGLVSSKVDLLEKEEDIIARIKEASAFFPLEKLCLSPQCGFASTEAGNRISDETQYAKIRLVQSVAKKVWG